MENIILSPIPLKDFETLIRDCIKSELQNHSLELPQDSDQVLTIKQASELTKLNVPTLYGYVSRNAIPFSKPKGTKRLWFSKKKLTEWLLQGHRKTIAEINSEANTYLKSKKR